MNTYRHVISMLTRSFSLGLMLLLSVAGWAQQMPITRPALSPADRPFAWVDGQPLQSSELHEAYRSVMRSKYYHGRVPDGAMQEVMKEAQDQVINGYLLAREVERLGIQPDRAKVDAEIATYEARYRDSAQWQQNREAMLPGLRAELERKSRLEVHEQQIKGAQVNDEEVRRYYESNPDKFTEPEKFKVQAILLMVDPSSSRATWDLAKEEALAIVKRLRQGADFGEAARMHSQDTRSATQNGDMGYLHRGMLPDGVQEIADKLAINEISDPIIILEGVTIVRITDRSPAVLRSFADVAERARQMVARERQDKVWQDYLAGLRKKADIRIDDGSSGPAR